MGDDEVNNPNTNSDSGTPNVATNEGSGVNPSSSSSAATGTPEPKFQTVPTSTFKKIKQDHFNKGRDEGLKQANARAQALGYKDYEDMANQVQASKANGTKNNQPRNGNGGQQRRDNGSGSGGGNSTQQASTEQPVRSESRKGREERIRDRQRRRDEQARDRANQEKLDAQAAADKLKVQNEELEGRLESERAESKLKLLAHRCGVQDVDYALTCLQRHLNGLSENDLKTFNNEEYFKTTLKKEKPYLYEATTELATTGTGGGSSAEGGEGAPGVTKQKVEAAPKKAVKDMSKQEYDAELRRRGMNPVTI